MPSTKVSALNAKTTPSGSEELLINDGGTSKKITIDNVTENNFTDTLKSKVDAIEASATADQTGSEIKTAYESEANAYTDTKDTKLSGIETSATADQSNSEIKTAYEANADTNEFSDAEQTKLSGIETSATADQTNAEIKTAYEANADTNEFSDAEQTKLSGIETGATADQTQSDINALNITATGVDLGNWTLSESAGVLYFATLGVNKGKLDASGNFTVAGNVISNGTV